MRRFALVIASFVALSLWAPVQAQRAATAPAASASPWRPAILSDNGMVASGHALAS